jgi:ABC-2 type transport system ATP-binding protein
MIQVVGLTKLYGDFRAVEELSFGVGAGEVLGLVGPNGAGKTTTLRCLVGIIRPSQGKITIAGHDLETDAIAAKSRLAFIPDEPRLFDYLTVAEHLRFAGRLYGVDGIEERAAALLREVELEGRERSMPGELSRGMKQKLAIACGLLHDPSVILLDEPLTGLDPVGIRRMKDAIARRAAAGAAVLISSHLLSLVEEICDRVLIIRQGRKVIHGSLDEIKASLPRLTSDASLEDIFFALTGDGGSAPGGSSPPSGPE